MERMTDFVEVETLRTILNQVTNERDQARKAQASARTLIQTLARPDGHFSPTCLPGMCAPVCRDAKAFLAGIP